MVRGDVTPDLSGYLKLKWDFATLERAGPLSMHHVKNSKCWYGYEGVMCWPRISEREVEISANNCSDCVISKTFNTRNVLNSKTQIL
jgi:mannose-6-phosphate isomerase-like protein (cupin superfamily)